MSNFVKIESVTVELSCPKRGQSEANRHVVSYFQSKKKIIQNTNQISTNVNLQCKQI